MAAPSSWDTFLSAIRAQESAGNYAENVPGCLGAYCWNAQSNWDTMAGAAGMSQYVGQNPATLPPTVQDQVASKNLSRVYGQTHSLLAAAMWWNGGQTTSVPNPGLPFQKWAPQCGGGSSMAYACQVLTRMKLGGHFLAGSSGAGSPSGSGGVVTTSATADCLIGFGGIPGTSWISDIFGGGGNLGQICLFSRPMARAVMGAGLIVAGALVAIPGLFLLISSAGGSSGGVVGQAATATSGAVGKVPFAAGAAKSIGSVAA